MHTIPYELEIDIRTAPTQIQITKTYAGHREDVTVKQLDIQQLLRER